MSTPENDRIAPAAEEVPDRTSDGTRRSIALGILAMLASVGCLSTMTMLVKVIGTDYSPFQATFMRNLFATLVIVPVVLWTGGPRAFKTKRPIGHGMRALAGLGANVSFFTAVTLIPMSAVSAVSMSVPIFATLMAIVFLREKVGFQRWAAILVGFAGVIVALDPRAVLAGSLNIGSLFALAGTMCWAGTIVAVKRLSTTESSATIVFYYMVIGVAASACVMPFVWVTPPWEIFRLYLVIGVVGAMGQLLMTLAIRLAPASVVTPFEYSTIVWATTFDLLLWQTAPAGTTFIGAGIVAVTGLYIAHRETRRRETVYHDDRGETP